MTLAGLDHYRTTDPREGDGEEPCECDDDGPCDECRGIERAVARCHRWRDDEHASDESEEADITW